MGANFLPLSRISICFSFMFGLGSSTSAIRSGAIPAATAVLGEIALGLGPIVAMGLGPIAISSSESESEPASDSESEPASDSSSESESESESDPNNKDNFEHIQNTCIIDDVCYNVDKIQPILNKTLETLNTEISNYPSPKLLLDAQNTICTTVLDKYLINSFIIDSTPVGNVLMRYSAVKLTFEYFSDKTVPRRFLETLARKYVVTFHCPHLYIDTNAEIAQITLSNNVKNTTAKLVKDEKVLNKSKQIFAKLKPYNVKPSSRSATTSHAIMAMKGRSKDSTTPFQFKLNDDNAEKINSKVMQNKSTSFTFIDRLSGFNPLQKKPVDKKASMTFAEYKTSLKV